MAVSKVNSAVEAGASPRLERTPTVRTSLRNAHESRLDAHSSESGRGCDSWQRRVVTIMVLCVALGVHSDASPTAQSHASDSASLPPNSTAAERIRESTAVDKNLGDRIGPFSLVDLDGKSWTATDWGDNTVIVIVWVTKCGWCERALPAIQRLNDALDANEGIRLVTFNMDADDVDLKTFMLARGYTFAVLRAGKFLKQTAIPSVFIVNREGVICDQIKGYGAGWVNTITARARTIASQSARPGTTSPQPTEH
jgi:thiol-disulfide isomerase/thioredoxin